MKLPFLVVLTAIAFAGPRRAPRKEVPIPISVEGGRILPREDKQELGKHCRAVRKWQELDGFKASAKINAWIRKAITVGKKLRKSDCPEPGSPEDLDYRNQATVNGPKGAMISVEIGVHFPGGSGRSTFQCETFDTATGQKVKLASFLTPAGKQKLAAKYCEAAKGDYFCKEGAVKDSCFLVQKEGLRAWAPDNGDWRRVGAELELPWGSIADYFDFPPELKKALAL